jgi:hypothetical protein
MRRENILQRGKQASQQIIYCEFDALTWNGKKDIKVYFECLQDYKCNLSGSRRAINNSALISKDLSSLLQMWKSQILASQGRPESHVSGSCKIPLKYPTGMKRNVVTLYFSMSRSYKAGLALSLAMREPGKG